MTSSTVGWTDVRGDLLAIEAWRARCAREVLDYGGAADYIERDDRTGMLEHHRCGFFPLANEDVLRQRPLVIVVHPLDCTCPGAPHVAQITRPLRGVPLSWPGGS